MADLPYMTLDDLCSAIAERTDSTYSTVRAVLDALSDLIRSEVAAGRCIRIRRLGMFRLRRLGRREGRDPRTGQTHIIGPSVLPAFRPSPIFRALVNQKRGAA